MSEKAFLALVLDAARLFGWLAYHTHDSRRSPSGFPDLVLCRAGRVIFAELKTAAGKVRAEQLLWAERLAAVGGKVEHHTWRPDDWDAIQQALR